MFCFSILSRLTHYSIQGRGEGLRGLKPLLSQVKVKKNDKKSDRFDLFLCLRDLKLCDLANLWS